MQNSLGTNAVEKLSSRVETAHFILHTIFYGSIHSHLFAYAAKIVGHWITIEIAIAPTSTSINW